MWKKEFLKMFTATGGIYSKRFLGTLLRNYSKMRNFSSVSLYPQFMEPLCCYLPQSDLQFYRYKSKGKNKSKKQGSDTESGEEHSEKDFLEGIQGKHTNTLKVNITSMRMDVILKVGLGLSRNKLESTFYESKIRLNGEKVLKKSAHINQGDEIDIIKGYSVNNKDFLTVARVEVLSAIPKEESIGVKLRRSKSLTIENYEGNNRWEE